MKKAWRRHNGGDPRPVVQGGQSIQWKVIGTNRASIKCAGQLDWSMTFEWRYV